MSRHPNRRPDPDLRRRLLTSIRRFEIATLTLHGRIEHRQSFMGSHVAAREQAYQLAHHVRQASGRPVTALFRCADVPTGPWRNAQLDTPLNL